MGNIRFCRIDQPAKRSGKRWVVNTQKTDMRGFKGMRFRIDVILGCIRW
jgi:hypothetical protein